MSEPSKHQPSLVGPNQKVRVSPWNQKLKKSGYCNIPVSSGSFVYKGFPGRAVVKTLHANAGDAKGLGSILGQEYPQK